MRQLDRKWIIINKKFVPYKELEELEALGDKYNPKDHTYIAFNLDEPYADEVLEIMAKHHKMRKVKAPDQRGNRYGFDEGP